MSPGHDQQREHQIGQIVEAVGIVAPIIRQGDDRDPFLQEGLEAIKGWQDLVAAEAI